VRRVSNCTKGVFAAVGLLAVSATGCKTPASREGSPTAPTIEDPVARQAAGAAEEASTPSKPPRERLARCPKGGRAFGLGDAGQKDDIEIGDALGYEGGFAVAFASRVGTVRKASVALFEPEAAGPGRIVELGRVLDDAPAPLLARRSEDVLAAVFSLPSSHPHDDRKRELSIYSVTHDRAIVVASFAKAADDSMASDIASDGHDAFVVWDEVSPGIAGATQSPGIPGAIGPAVARGVIRGAPVTLGEPKIAPRDLSPAESDAEDPRVVADSGGYSVLWLARSPADAAPSDASEVTGEGRAFGWLQRVEIDPMGAPRGPVRDLTPRSGHVSAYDARVFGDGGALVVFARDDGEPTDGSGGALLRVRSRGGAIEPAQTLEVGGVAHGAPSFIEGKPPWLTWVGHDEQLRLLPLDETGSPSGLPSAEDALSEARPLEVWSSPSSALGRWLIATPSDPSGPLRSVECALAKGL
jgi:hypothetical protein